MKKTLSIALILMILVSGLFILTGCEEKGGKEAKNDNYDKYELETKFNGKLTFELEKNLGYEMKKDTNKVEFTHKDNKSTITIYAMDTSKSSIIMGEKDFSKDAYTGYTKMEIAGREAYTISKTNNFAITYGILLDDYDKQHGKYHGVKVVVSKNSLKLDEFDPAAFTQTEGFKHFLESIKFEATPAATETTTNTQAQ